jgi:peptidoglycan/xylan/chitin deacetylase (PgdA/CDA1 family)
VLVNAPTADRRRAPVSRTAGGRVINAAVIQLDAVAAPASLATVVAVAHLPAVPTIAPTEPAPTAKPPTAVPDGQVRLPVPPTPVQAQAAEPATPLPILEYHRSSFERLPTVRMRPAWLEAQLPWLMQAGFHTLSSAELAGFVAGTQPAPARSAALTFDVAASHLDEYSQAIIPALRRYHPHAIFFVMPSQTRDTRDGQMACWPSWLAWRDEGLISIESHSFYHFDYARLSPERLAYNGAHSRAAIQAKTGQPVLGLCYPFDSVAPAAVDLLSAAGYKFAVAGATRRDRSAECGDRQPYTLPRYYPYSGNGVCPVIAGTHGQTFDHMMLAAVAETK